MSLESMLINRCTIKRWSARKPGADFTINKPSYVVFQTDVALSLQVYSGSRKTTVAGADVTYNAVAFFEYDVDIRPSGGENSNDDLIVVTDPATDQQFCVKAVFDESGHGLFKKALLLSEW